MKTSPSAFILFSVRFICSPSKPPNGDSCSTAKTCLAGNRLAQVDLLWKMECLRLKVAWG